MKKKNLLVLLSLPLVLTACSFELPSFNPGGSSSQTSYKSHGTIGGEVTSSSNQASSSSSVASSSKASSSSKTSSSKAGSSEVKSSTSINQSDDIGYKTVDLTKAKIKSMSDIVDYEGGMPTKGKRKVLVIPVEFNDCTASSKGYNISNLEKLFNGKGASSSFTSVKDYFYKSSYGQLELEFDIMPNWFKPSNNWSYYRTKVPTDIYGYSGSDSQATGEQLILNEALKSYDSTLNYKDYDSDNNGTIDSVIMIYTKDYDANEDGDSLAWAWRFWNLLGDTSNTYPGGGYEYYCYDECNANDYLWASYKFMFDGGTKGQDLDIYTYCHEFSHVLGLDDYYDTEYIKHPMDGYDMMDAKMGDHCMYSKMALGWLDNVRLITTNSSVTIELKDMEKEGDAILIANNFNDTLGAFQEYWLIQYYTNNGLNAIGNIFPSNGIIVYHIDSSVTYESKYEGYTINNNNTAYTNKNGYGTRNNLIEFVPYSSSSNIYKANADLNKSLKDNKGNTIPHTFHIDNISGDTATLTFKKL